MPSVAALAVSFRPHAVARIPSPFHSYFLRTMATSETAPVSFLLCAATCRPAHSTTASFARLRPSQLCPFSSFFAPCLALLAHTSRDVFVRCFQRCRYGSSAYSAEHLRKFISPRLLRPPTHPTSARPTVPYPFPEGRALDCTARRWRVKISGAGTFSCLGYFLLGLIWTSLGAGVAL